MRLWFKMQGRRLRQCQFYILAYLQRCTIIMISSVVYKGRTSNSLTSTDYQPNQWPLLHIVAAKALVLLLLLTLGEAYAQQIACLFVTLSSSLQFWLTKNVGRKYLQASWTVDTSNEEEVWVYQASFASPSSFEQVFWYCQIAYGACLVVAFVLVAVSAKLSLLCAIMIAFAANYVNFFAFSKIIEMRNAGIFEQIAQDAKAQGELRETIRLPMVHRSQTTNRKEQVQGVFKSFWQ